MAEVGQHPSTGEASRGRLRANSGLTGGADDEIQLLGAASAAAWLARASE